MVRAAALACLALLAGCGVESEAQQRAESDRLLNVRLDRLEGRVGHIEADRGIEKATRAAAPAPVPVVPIAGAVLIGSTTRGEPVSREFSSLGSCQSARAGLVSEAERICDQRKSEPGVVAVDCLYPQLACSRKELR